MKRLTRAAAVSAAATALVLSTTPFASAGSGFHVYTNPESNKWCSAQNEDGSAKFEDDDEIVTLYDHRADGHGIGAWVYVNGHKEYTVTTRGSNTHDLKIIEGSRVTVRVWVWYPNAACGEDSETGYA